MWRSYLARVLVWFVALAGLGLQAARADEHGQRLRKRDRSSRGHRFPGGTATLTGPSAPTTTSVDAQGSSGS